MSLADLYSRRKFSETRVIPSTKEISRQRWLSRRVKATRPGEVVLKPGEIDISSVRIGSRLTIPGGHSYVLRGKLGEGAFGEIFQADDYPDGNEGTKSIGTVAIKLLIVNPTTYAGTSLSTIDITEQIENEVKSLMKISKYPSCSKLVVCYYNYYRFGSKDKSFVEKRFLYIIVMEYMRGGDLLDYINDESQTARLSRLVDISIQMAESVALVHNHDIIHKDIKPENYLLNKATDPTVVKLADFGLSGEMMPAKCARVSGSLDFIAPELLYPHTAQMITTKYCEKQDSWSLGVTYLTLWLGWNLWDLIKVEGDDEKVGDNQLAKAKMMLDKIYGMPLDGWEAIITPAFPPDLESAQDIIYEILVGLLQRDPKFRMTAATAAKKWKEVKKRVTQLGVGDKTWAEVMFPEEAGQEIVVEEVVA